MSQYRRRLLIASLGGGTPPPPPVVNPIFQCSGTAKDGHTSYITDYTPQSLGEFMAICIADAGAQGAAAYLFMTGTSTTATTPYIQAYYNSGAMRLYYNDGAGRKNLNIGSTRFALRFKNGTLHYKTPTKDWTLVTSSHHDDVETIKFFGTSFTLAYTGALYDSASIPDSVINEYFTMVLP